MIGKEILFRASEVGALMIGGGDISPTQKEELQRLREKVQAGPLTANQLKQLEELLQKKECGKLTEAQSLKLEQLEAKAESDPLTPNQREKLSQLEAREAAGFQLGKTATTLIKKVWLREELGYREPVVTDELMKGLLCEQDSLDVLTKFDGCFRLKNDTRYNDPNFIGTPDVILTSQGIVEDVKTSWSFRTFLQPQKAKQEYFAQLQVYMHLIGIKTARLRYVLVPTPEVLVERMERKMLAKYGWDEDNKHYIEACRQIRYNHIELPNIVPVEKRVRTFEFEYDEAYMKELIFRVEKAREYYDRLTERVDLEGFFELDD